MPRGWRSLSGQWESSSPRPPPTQAGGLAKQQRRSTPTSSAPQNKEYDEAFPQTLGIRRISCRAQWWCGSAAGYAYANLECIHVDLVLENEPLLIVVLQMFFRGRSDYCSRKCF